MSGTTVPAAPSHLDWHAWWGVLRRTVRQFQDNKITDWAAALTYYSVLSVFPGLLVLTAILGLLGPSATQSLIDTIRQFGNNSGTALLIDGIEQLQGTRSLAGPLAILGLGTSLWTASGYIGAFIRAANAIYRTEEGRPIWKTVPLRVSLTATMVLLVAVCALGVVLTGRVADRVGRWLGLGSAGILLWDIAKWPVLIILVSLAFALLYWASPNARQLGFRWLTPGSTLAVLLWIAASAGFTVYATNFGSYNKVYGSLAGAVVFLVWLWLTNVAVLLGAQLDAELARGHQIEHGQPEDHEPVLPHRDEPDE
ncbi:YihY/virulence factor BrkB family protein [Nocardia sp. CDC159]|uniref:YihY/virulence factor BrkB family protein n=1 Tax=Nocardia pulmonis TaxID=2951408 RepID=A0A9X2J2I3_9NOCA|nr:MULTISPECIES: YihY/virulence factor BrkB family protein [Nocardia]MCM6778076.1 YihY/virulence factor BrkB family protein [Nocardia pulmonis]MCM6790965.1 YihY/virulence factor BrkB family protein [Nocardia sp. CDC159]